VTPGAGDELAPGGFWFIKVELYLAGRPSTHVITLAHQHTTKHWWEVRRRDFELYVSEAVLQEIMAGDPTAAQERAAVIQGISILAPMEKTGEIAEGLIKAKLVPQHGAIDAIHIATAAAHGMEYLLTWNCKHIANAEMRPKIEKHLRSLGYEPPEICTPDELMGDDTNDENY
jgi:predicted nucleic acid-binding protein